MIAKLSLQKIFRRSGKVSSDCGYAQDPVYLDCLFLYRTRKKLHYFSNLAKHSLSEQSCLVQHYHALKPGKDRIHPPKANLAALLDAADTQTFNGITGLLPELARPVVKLLRNLQIKKIYSRLFSLLAERQPKVIVIWNGHKYQDVILHEVNRHFNIPVVYFEIGLLPNSTTVDSRGINACSSIPRDPEFFLNLTPRACPERTIVGRQYRHRAKAFAKPSELPEEYILVPFQKERDSQIINNSQWIKSMPQLVTAIEQAMATLNRPIPVILRPHPSDSSRFRKLKRHVESIPWMQFDQSLPLAQAVGNARAILTINSSVGMESILLNKKVIVLGEAFYGIPGLVMTAKDVTTLGKALANIEEFAPHAELRARFIEYLTWDYIVETEWQKTLGLVDGEPPSVEQQRHFAQVAARIVPFCRQSVNLDQAFEKALLENKSYCSPWDNLGEYAQKFIPRRHRSSYTQLDPQRYRNKVNAQSIELVSHCWGYSHFLYHQLNSLIQYPPKHVWVVVTVFYSIEDKDTCALLTKASAHSHHNISWNFIPLSNKLLFRRAIGRNLAALATQADWIWFTDCDTLFVGSCLDQLATVLNQQTAPLVYPSQELRSIPLPAEHPWINHCAKDFDSWPIDQALFFPTKLNRATGPMQITRGDVARQLGYCKDSRIFQRPAKYWRKANEDRLFRQQFGGDAKAVDIDGVLRIQHQDKGRYRQKQLAVIRKLGQNIKTNLWLRWQRLP